MVSVVANLLHVCLSRSGCTPVLLKLQTVSAAAQAGSVAGSFAPLFVHSSPLLLARVRSSVRTYAVSCLMPVSLGPMCVRTVRFGADMWLLCQAVPLASPLTVVRRQQCLMYSCAIADRDWLQAGSCDSKKA